MLVEADFIHQAVDELLLQEPLASWKAYLRWHLARATSDLLPKAFQDEAFAFYGQKLSGQKEQQPRWKRCVTATTFALAAISAMIR